MKENRIQRGMSFEEKFFRNIYPEPNSGCWLWGGYSNLLGYGQIYVMDKRKQSHRFSYEFHYNIELNDTQLICHRCNMPSCWNPNHLYIGTQSINMMQAYKEGRFGINIFQEKKVFQYSRSCKLINIFNSIMEAHRKTKISASSISNNCNGKIKKQHKFIWSFIPLSEIDETEMINEKQLVNS
jgi:hypothetical protein